MRHNNLPTSTYLLALPTHKLRSRTGLLKLWVTTPNGVAKQIGILCFVPRNFVNRCSVAELFGEIMVISHVMDKSENLGDKNRQIGA